MAILTPSGPHFITFYFTKMCSESSYFSSKTLLSEHSRLYLPHYPYPLTFEVLPPTYLHCIMCWKE